jgi:hypothetical protein
MVMKRDHVKKLATALAATALCCGAALGCNEIFGTDAAGLDPTLADGAINPFPDAGVPDGHMGMDAIAPPPPVDAPPPPPEAGDQPPSCDTYCNLVVAYCTGGNQQYFNLGACLDMCNSHQIELGSAGETTTNSIACRQHYAGLAAQGQDPVASCRAAGPVGGKTCGSDYCQNYCLLNTAFCSPTVTGSPNFWSFLDDAGMESETLCEQACATWPYYDTRVTFLTSDGYNSLNCRDYHLQSLWEIADGGGQMPLDYYHCNHTRSPAPAFCTNNASPFDGGTD